MTEAPERIYISGESWPEKISLSRRDAVSAGYKPDVGQTEYIRADLVPQWRDIGTANEDECDFESPVLLYWPVDSDNPDYPDAVPYPICTGYFGVTNGRTYQWIPLADVDLDREDNQPTHWMPLPQPPKEKP